jgi:hypothetical protein
MLPKISQHFLKHVISFTESIFNNVVAAEMLQFSVLLMGNDKTSPGAGNKKLCELINSFHSSLWSGLVLCQEEKLN